MFLCTDSAPLPEDPLFRVTFVCDDALACESMVEWEYYTNQKKSVAWINPECACTVLDNLEPDGATKTCRTSITSCCPSARSKPNGQQKLKNMDKQLARQARLERLRGGHPRQGATAPTASASASAASAATAAALAESAIGGP
eukprot:jgi/Tetstr1/461780/TSEL_006867.t1